MGGREREVVEWWSGNERGPSTREDQKKEALQQRRKELASPCEKPPGGSSHTPVHTTSTRHDWEEEQPRQGERRKLGRGSRADKGPCQWRPQRRRGTFPWGQLAWWPTDATECRVPRTSQAT